MTQEWFLQRGQVSRKVPKQFLSWHEGVQFLQLRPTAPWLCALLCGKCPRGMSLASSEQLEALKVARDRAADAAMRGDSLFAEERAPKRRRASADHEEVHVVSVDVSGTRVQMLVPLKHSMDLRVAWDSAQLAAVFDKLAQDCESCAATSAREYVRSGRFTAERPRGGGQRGRPRGRGRGTRARPQARRPGRAAPVAEESEEESEEADEDER